MVAIWDPAAVPLHAADERARCVSKGCPERSCAKNFLMKSLTYGTLRRQQSDRENLLTGEATRERLQDIAGYWKCKLLKSFGIDQMTSNISCCLMLVNNNNVHPVSAYNPLGFASRYNIGNTLKQLHKHLFAILNISSTAERCLSLGIIINLVRSVRRWYFICCQWRLRWVIELSHFAGCLLMLLHSFSFSWCIARLIVSGGVSLQRISLVLSVFHPLHYLQFIENSI